jgi:choline dehydrogenase-like flavoprotein
MIHRTLEGLGGEIAQTLIAGSGPAGLTLAMELARQGQSCVVLESGGKRPGPAQELSRAEIVDPALHDDMSIAVSRRLGGASNLWGGRCIPLDPRDFEPRAFAQGARWPLRFDELAPYYERACRYANCGEAVFTSPLPGAPSDEAFSVDRIERASNAPAFQKAHAALLDSSPAIDIRLGATVTDFRLGEDGRVRGARVVGRDGVAKELSAGRVVLAAGGLESTRLLLALQRHHANLFGGADGPLGRYYMGHFIGDVADVIFADAAIDAAFDFAQDGHGSFTRRRFTPSRQTQERFGLPNVCFWPIVAPIADPRHRSGPLSAVALALSTPVLGERLVPTAIRKRHLSAGVDWSAHLSNVCLDIPGTLRFLGDFLHKRYLSRERVSGYFLRNRARRYGLAFSSEQSPRADSRVRLSEERDSVGLPRLEINLRYHRDDAAGIARAHVCLGSWLRKTNLGKLEYRQPEAENVDAIYSRAGHGTHQIGTTRMGCHRGEGVVNRDLRTFDCPNLFVVSSSVFPTSGQANPTLSIVALAARLADAIVAESRAGAPPLSVETRLAPSPIGSAHRNARARGRV